MITIKTLTETIYETTDYDKFHFITGNRPVRKMDIQRLAKRMLKVGFLPNRAIEVNPDMGIVDGQKRYLAAQEAGLPVLYKIAEKSMTLEDIQGLQMQKAWTTQDYLSSYIVLGNKDYIKLKAFADEYRLSIAIAYNILSDNARNGFNVLHAMQDGVLEFPDLERSERLASLVSEVRNYSPDRAFSDRECITALRILMDKVDPKKLFDQAKRYQQVITRRVSTKDYLLQFENILNQGNQGKQIELT